MKKTKFKKSVSKDAWRFTLIGSDDWLINYHQDAYSEDDLISILDGEEPADAKVDVHSLLESLPERYKTILWEYFFDGLTLEKMGAARSVTKQYMHQELTKAIALIKKSCL